MKNLDIVEKKREKLHKMIDIHGLNYEKIIDTDKELHISINKMQREKLSAYNS